MGQASQPIMSTNFGAGKGPRIKSTLRLALWTTAFFGVFWTALSLAFPNLYIRIFMSPTAEILEMAPPSSGPMGSPSCCCPSISSRPTISRPF